MENTMRKSGFVVTIAILSLCATMAFGKSIPSFIGGRMRVNGTTSGQASGPCPSPPYAQNCPPAPNTTANCFCIEVTNAAVTGARIGKGTADLTLTQDAGNGNGSDGSESSSNCWPIFGGGVFTDSKTAAQATLNIVGTLCLGKQSNSPPVLKGGYTVASGGTGFGTVSGTVGDSVSLSFIPK
jgi:hypothetical protein